MDGALFWKESSRCMKQRIVALIGAGGQLGSDLYTVLSKESAFHVYPLAHKNIEISDVASVNSTLKAIQPHVVINTAAYHAVDEAEDDPGKAFRINTIGPMLLARFCEANKADLVSLSTDYVFGLDGSRKLPYCEDDCPGPVNMYGISKLAGEYAIRQNCSRYFILRTSGLFGLAGPSGKGGRNFIETMMILAKEKKHIRVVNDQFTAPTYTVDLAYQVRMLLNTNGYGLYHASSQGSCSWFDFAQAIFNFIHTDVSLEAVPSSVFPTKAKRPGYSVLDDCVLRKKKLLTIPHWQQGLKSYLLEKGYMYS